MLNIIIHTFFRDSEGHVSTGSNSFKNDIETTSHDIFNLLESKGLTKGIIPSLYYLQNLDNAPNIFKPSAEAYTIEITEVSLNYVLPQDCWETGKNISEFLAIVNGKVSPVLADLSKKALVDINESVIWYNSVSSKFKDIKGLDKINKF